MIALASRSLALAGLIAALACAPGCAGTTRGAGQPAPTAPAESTLEGTLEVLIEDSERSSRTLYFLIDNARRIELRLMGDPANLATGTFVRVTGTWDDTVFVVRAIDVLRRP